MNLNTWLGGQLSGRKSLLLACGLPALVGIFLLLTNSMVPFANDGHCDPWHYFGYFYLDDQFSMMGDSRTYSRLPMTILGFVLTRIFHSVLADYAQFLVWLTLISGSVFVAADRLFGRLPAIVASLFIATNGIVIGVLSVDYTGPALAWSAIAMTSAVLAPMASTARHRRIFLLAAGFFWGTALIGHFYSITYNFAVPLYAISWRKDRLKSLIFQLASIGVHVLVGGMAALVGFGLVSKYLLGAEFTFFLHQYLEVFTVTAEGYRKAVTLFYKPDWYLFGGKLALVSLGLAISLWQIAAALLVRTTVWERVVGANVPLAIMTLAMLLFTAVGGVTLQFDYYYVWMLPALALSIASVVSRVELPAIRQVAMGACYALLALAGTFAGYQTFLSVKPSWPSLVVATVVGVLSVAITFRPNQNVLLATLCALALLGITVRPERMGVQVWDGSTGGAAMYQRVREGWEFLSRFPFPERPTFWLDATGPMSETVAYPRGFEYCQVDTALPRFLPADNSDPRAALLARKRFLVMAAPNQSKYEEAVENLKRERGLAFQELARKHISGHGLQYELVVGKLSPVGRSQ